MTYLIGQMDLLDWELSDSKQWLLRVTFSSKFKHMHTSPEVSILFAGIAQPFSAAYIVVATKVENHVLFASGLGRSEWTEIQIHSPISAMERYRRMEQTTLQNRYKWRSCVS